MMCHRSRGPLRAHVLVLMAPMLTMASGCLISWLQFGGGDGHSSNNTSETTLTASNVSSLHRVWQANLGDTADGAPVYLLNASTPSGNMSLVFATTRGGRIVAVNEATGAVVWSKTFGPGTCRINNGSTPCYTTSSPAIDPNGQYVYSYGLDGVHKLAVSDGAETLTGGWPELVTRKGWDEKGSSALSMAKAKNGVTFLYMDRRLSRRPRRLPGSPRRHRPFDGSAEGLQHIVREPSRPFRGGSRHARLRRSAVRSVGPGRHRVRRGQRSAFHLDWERSVRSRQSPLGRHRDRAASRWHRRRRQRRSR